MDEPVNSTEHNPTEHNPTEDAMSPVEEKLTATLHAHGEKIEPHPDSLQRLHDRLVEGGAGGHRKRFGFAPQQIVIAAVFLAIAGFSVAALTRVGGQEVESVPADTTEQAALSTTSTTPPASVDSDDSDGVDRDTGASNGETSQSDSEIADVVPGVAIFDGSKPEPGFVAGPVRATREEAAAAFMDLIRLPYASFEFDGDRAIVLSLDEEGAPSRREAAELRFETLAGDSGATFYAVAEATSLGMSIDSPAPGTITTDPSITVAGVGSGFEAGVAVRLISSFDGLMLDQQPGLAGWEPAPFEVTVDAAGVEHGWAVAISSIGADFITPPFAAVPIGWDLEPDPTTYTVSHIDFDDSDGGLNVRNSPSLSESEIVATLPTGTSGLIRRPRLPVLVEGSVFWSVTTPTGVEGWVNRRFLVGDGDVDTAVLLAVGEQLATGLTSGNRFDLTFLPWATAKPVLVGWAPDLPSIEYTQLSSFEFWDTPRQWTVPEETFGVASITDTPLQFLTPAFELTATERVAGAASSPYPLVQDWIDSEFAGLDAVELTAASVAGGDPDRSFTIFMEQTPEGAQIVGIAVHLWIP